MSLGKIIRNVLGKKLFMIVGKLYKAFFFNLNCFVSTLPDLKKGSVLFDIGGGEGDPINYVLKKYPETNVIMLDIAEEIGSFLNEENKNSVKMLPKTSISDCLNLNLPKPDFILIMDVLHHIKKDDRKELFTNINRLIDGNKCQIIVKENEPGYLKTKLGYWADVYISGDKNTNLVSKKDLLEFMESEFENLKYHETDLFKLNKPNYSFVFSVNHY